MGKYVVEFDENYPDEWKPETDGPQISFVVAEEKEKPDGPFQKALCYASYYTMTFSAICAFSPGSVASAAELIKSTLG